MPRGCTTAPLPARSSPCPQPLSLLKNLTLPSWRILADLAPLLPPSLNKLAVRDARDFQAVPLADFFSRLECLVLCNLGSPFEKEATLDSELGASMQGLTALREVTVRDAPQLRGAFLPPVLRDNCQLRLLDLSSNPLLDLEGCSFQAACGLQELMLDGTRISDATLAPLLRACTGLADLVLAGTAVGGDTLELLACSHPGLRRLNLLQVALEQKALQSLRLQSLHSLRFGGPHVAVRGVELEELLRACPELLELEISGARVSERIVIELFSSRLRSLRLDNLKDGKKLREPPPPLAKNEVLRTLSLVRFPYTLPDFTRFLSLQELDLTGNHQVNNDMVKAVACVTTLSTVSLSECPLTMKGVVSLVASLPNLTTLDLAGCNHVEYSTKLKDELYKSEVRSINISDIKGLEDSRVRGCARACKKVLKLRWTINDQVRRSYPGGPLAGA